LHGIPKLGDICSLESKINVFQRVQVVGVVKENSEGIAEELRVKFIDEGTFSVLRQACSISWLLPYLLTYFIQLSS
jgi:hypothetical protein